MNSKWQKYSTVGPVDVIARGQKGLSACKRWKDVDMKVKLGGGERISVCVLKPILNVGPSKGTTYIVRVCSKVYLEEFTWCSFVNIQILQTNS